MNITEDKITIRNAGSFDCEKLLEWWNDGAVMTHAGFPNGLGTNIEKISNQLKNESDEKGRVHIIEYDGLPIGEIHYRNKGDKKAEIGIKICDFKYQNKGLGRVILSIFIRELFNMGYEKIVLDTSLDNKRAHHVYELLGFKKIKVNVDSWKNQEGKLQSSVNYELEKKT